MGQTNILDVRAAVKWERVPFVESLLDPEIGVSALWNLEIVRDNDEFTMLRNAGMNPRRSDRVWQEPKGC